MEIIYNILTYYKYKSGRKENFHIERHEEVDSEIRKLKSKFRESSLKKSSSFKIKPFLTSYIAASIWREKQNPKYKNVEKFVYQYHYAIGAFPRS